MGDNSIYNKGDKKNNLYDKIIGTNYVQEMKASLSQSEKDLHDNLDQSELGKNENNHKYIEDIIEEHNRKVLQKDKEEQNENFIDYNIKKDHHLAVFFEKINVSEKKKRASLTALLRKLLDPPKNPYKRMKDIKNQSNIPQR
jgi:hypothetical protein